MNALDTIDSSGPVWAAITGHEYSIDTDSLQAVSKIKMPVDFDYPYSKNLFNRLPNFNFVGFHVNFKCIFIILFL